ncbi:hypothetical protein [Nonomuraea cavernae]|uniref:hypothetical protein n=1 Tax=Nonomuraea cavernae TaxID=2045107 RepID=UPI0033D70903
MNDVDEGEDRLSLLMVRVRRLREIEAGNPSFKRLEKVARALSEEDSSRGIWLRPLPKSTVCDLINGKSKKLPDWLLLRTVVDVCHLIATKSGIPIDPLEDLTREFAVLWREAKEDEGVRASAAKHGRKPPEAFARDEQQIGGDVLEPAPGERSSWKPSATTQRVPLDWGRLGNLRLKRAESGDANAAYELAVLLACEACSKGDSDKEKREARHWRFLAAYWNGRAIGVIAAAAEFQLQGRQLVKAARALAREYAEAGKPSSAYFCRAMRQAEASLQAQPAAVPDNEASEPAPVPGTTVLWSSARAVRT